VFVLLLLLVLLVLLLVLLLVGPCHRYWCCYCLC
jgi:hypothetical protein